MGRTYRIVTRKSKMAMAQTLLVQELLQAAAPDDVFELIPMSSDGCYERFKGDLQTIGGKGAFVKTLELAMLAGDADLAMHSLKDVPTDEDLPEGLVIPCVLKRDDPRDVVVTRNGEKLADLQNGARIGTSSVRRGAQLAAKFPHLQIVPLRGNADTRIGKVDNGEVDAAILAAAGLFRIGLEARIAEYIEPEEMLPAVGQGTVCVECKSDDAEALALLAKINHAPSFVRITAERSLLKALGGSCHTPIGAYCVETEQGLHLRGLVSSLDGLTVVKAEAYGDDPEVLGKTVAELLDKQGAQGILAACAEAT